MGFLQHCIEVDGKEYCWDENTASVVQVDFTINRLGKDIPERAIAAILKARLDEANKTLNKQ